MNEKIEKAVIQVSINDNLNLKNLQQLDSSSFTLPIEKLAVTLENISKELDAKGKSFSKVQLKNIQLKEKTLFADLDVYQSEKRTISNVIIKGYTDFPRSFVKHFFNINQNTIFNQEKVDNISNATKNLQFVKEIKPPEVLFTKDSTELYIYLKKQQNNSFDGLVNLTTKENGDVLFNGHVDLKLQNVLNTGETFELFWNSIGEDRQEFSISTDIPYIFNTIITPELTFSIYKQDSTFLNTTFNSKLFYNLNSKSKLALTYTSESSENLEETIQNNIETFKNFFAGFEFKYAIPKNDFFFNDVFYASINPTFGKRTTDTINSNQFKIEAEASYIWDLNTRSSIFIRNKTGYLNSDFFIDNELFRIGGANSIRGFNEQSIFSKSYSFFNLEYRFLTSEKSYFYSITDFANIKTIIGNDNLLGLGLGYLFSTSNSQINLSTAIGKTTSQNFDFKESKLIISWKSFF
ncbi:hypothetical protein [Polaribacter sp.]|uniref:hypothetical protein n=1 Tax=Polaribacter sp. TaxID=1920175 RepID=UPI003EF974DE